MENGSQVEENFAYNPAKNYDEETIEQQKLIDQEIAAEQPLIGKKVTLEEISSEYAKEDSVYREKVKILALNYKHVRRTRGDGNCFLRAFGYSYLEYLTRNSNEVEKFLQIILGCKQNLIHLGYSSFTIEDFYDTFVSIVEDVRMKKDADKLLEVFNDQSLSDYIVVFLRLIISGHLQKEHEFYMHFLDTDQTLQQFCQQEVEPMGKESDHIHVMALTTSLSVPVQIAYMDRGEGDTIVKHTFPADSEPHVILLYRPGHYDILYNT